MKSRKCALHADCGLGGIEAHRKIVQHDIDDIVADLAGIVGIVGQSLVVCNEDIDFIEFA